MRFLPVCLAATLAVTGCASSGSWRDDGFASTRASYSVAFAKGRELLGEEWSLDNWEGSGTSRSEKTRGRFSAIRRADYNNDGKIDSDEEATESVFDLAFVHKRDKSVIWVKGHPIPKSDEETELATVFRVYADSLAGRGLYAQGSVFGLSAPRTREFTTFVRDTRSEPVGGQPGYVGVVEIAETIKLASNPTHRDELVSVALVKTRYSRQVADPKGVIADRALVVAGYSADAQSFPLHEQEFRAFVSQLRVTP